jgi:CRISPR-associated protein Csm5
MKYLEKEMKSKDKKRLEKVNLKMPKINIQTLTPTHIGSGREIQGGYEYVYFKDERKIGVLDPKKVLDIIHEDNLAKWISCIETAKSITENLPQLKSCKSDDISERVITCNKTVSKPVREQLHTGSGMPMIPGSSLKGALRTAVWAETLLDNAKLAKDKRNLGNVDFRGGFRWSDAPLQKTLFGSDPNHDIFRLLQVGDAHFVHTEVFQTQVLNLKGSAWKIDRGEGKGISPEAWVEALPTGTTTTCHIQFNENLLKQAGSHNTFNGNASKLQLTSLFALVNTYTQRLVSDEVDFWKNQDTPDGFQDFVTEMEVILAATQACGEHECIIRVGWGSGFRSMTGDWHAAMDENDYENLISSLRPRKYEGLMFPKTTRFTDRGVPLGFVKLSY